MAEWRVEGDPCPIEPEPAAMAMCQPCPYFRGASSLTGRKGWKINCNWPRNGSHIATMRTDPLDDLDAETIRQAVSR